MKRTFIAIGTVAIVTFSSAFFTTVEAKSGNLDDIKVERKEVKSQLSKAEQEVADVLLEIKEIGTEISELNDSLKANEEAIHDTEEEIIEIEKEIAELEKKIEERFEILKERAKSYQETGGNVKYIDVILGAKSFNEFISRVNAVSKIADSDASLIKMQEEDKAKVEEKLEELTDLKNELETIKEEIEEQKAESESKQKALHKKEKEYKKLVSDLKIKDSKLASMEANVLASMAPAVVASSGSTSGSGILGWPTQGGYISSPMGSRNGRMHKGIDIARTDRSTSPPIYAADGGTVVSAGSSGAYGNKVVIDHGNGMRTLYAHMASINVSTGQSVSKGTTLGIMGTTGRSTGIHLHFEVYVNGALQNPTGYLR